MAVPTLTNILKRILKQPTAPFHEYHVRNEIENLLADCPNVKLKHDRFGNLIATYKNGKRPTPEQWVLGAHMDHPGFVKTPGSKKRGSWDFLGGVSPEVVEMGVQMGLRKVKGSLATWKFPVVVNEEKVEAPACDDLVGCAAIVAVFWGLASLNIKTTVHAVFTRAEEVGFIGAWHVGQKWKFGENAVFISVETSRPVNGAFMGEGPVLRVGDRLSIFDPDAIDVILKTSVAQGLRVQRTLLDAGACEASAIRACGHRSVGLSIPLGNYHNTDEAKNIAPEYVMMGDVKELVSLLKGLVGAKPMNLGVRSLEERYELRLKEHEAHLKAARKLF
jgi:endoglucanase